MQNQSCIYIISQDDDHVTIITHSVDKITSKSVFNKARWNLMSSVYQFKSTHIYIYTHGWHIKYK